MTYQSLLLDITRNVLKQAAQLDFLIDNTAVEIKNANELLQLKQARSNLADVEMVLATVEEKLPTIVLNEELD